MKRSYYLLVLVAVILVTILSVVLQDRIFLSPFTSLRIYINNATVANGSCAFPQIAHNDSLALDYLKRDFDRRQSGYNKCENKGRSLELLKITTQVSSSSSSLLTLNESLIFEKFNLTLDKLKCSIVRFDKAINKPENHVVNYEKTYFIDNTVNLTVHGFYFLNCVLRQNEKISVYKNVYTILPANMSALMNERQKYFDREAKLQKPLNHTYGRPTRLFKQKNRKKLNRKQNVLIIGFDSMSLSHFQRIMPLTFDFLNNQLSQSIVFRKFNSVGLNTYPSIMGLLTGERVYKDLEKYKANDGTYHDQYPFIWYDYEKLGGYFTSFQEDAPHIGLVNYLKRGFRFKPTAYYGRGYWLKHYSIRTGGCLNSRPHYKVYIDQLEQLLDRLSTNNKLPFFSFNFLADYTHDSFSIPAEMDRTFFEMFKRFDRKGFFKQTLLIVLSDHGNRLTSYPIYTATGKLERFLPFLSVRLPDALHQTQLHQNLISNSDKLVGSFDLHQTLRHFLHLNMEQTVNGLDTAQYYTNDPLVRHLRGISLFEKIPVNRTCSNALIPDEYCPCYQRHDIKEREFTIKTNFNFKSVTNLIIQTIGNYTEGIRHLCAAYKFDKIQTSKYWLYGQQELYQFVILLQPGDASFEAIIRVEKMIGLKIKGEVNRLSKYGKQSACVQDSFLRNFCFCK